HLITQMNHLYQFALICIKIDTNGSFNYSNEIEVTVIPDKYELLQNYPNPFNPSTEIIFSIPKEEELTLKVFDLLGHEVKTLVKGIYKPGSYKILFDGSDLSSGLYFYELKTSGFHSVRKMVLIK
ncbi:MAG TPA: T9SS type A sorting domain-containing protein, partial [Ignavibacteriaceae bacterium]|nr:T9SS type A sorting domain-containing protein [Ignavibacteriaceae bacterium]